MALPPEAPRARIHDEREFRLRSLQAIIAISLVTSVFAFAVSFGWNASPADRLGPALLMFKNVLFLAWLWRRPRHLGVVGVLYFVILALTGLVKFADAALLKQASHGLGSYSYWLPLSYVVAFLVFEGRRALLASLAVYLPLLAVGALYWLTVHAPTETRHITSQLLVQVYLTHATYISFFTLFGALQERYVQTLIHAENEARGAYLDVLTGAPNRRQLSLWLSGEIERASTLGQPLSIVLFDLDRFKQVNDVYGHDAGDKVLQATARTVMHVLRRGDLFGRWGGEEFLLILPGTGLGEAQGVAERVRREIALWRHGPLQVTASLGAAQLGEGESLTTLLGRADAALYAAKHAGRNQVVPA